MVDAPALTRLVRDVPAFLDDGWGHRPWHIEAADPDAFGDLLSLEHVDHLLASTGLRAPGFRLVRQGRTLPMPQVTRHARIGGRPVSDLVDVRSVHDAVADGATLVLQGLHRSFAPVAGLCRDLEATLTHAVQANAYLTPPTSQGLDLHADPHDVFAVQTYGRKRWVVHPPDGSEPWDLDLRPGDVLYLPAGTRHAAQTVGDPSLHLTIGVRPTTWRSLVDRVVAAAMADVPGLDEPLPVAWAEVPETLDATLTARLGEVVAAIGGRGADEAERTTALRAAADRFHRGRVADRAGGLVDLLELDRLDDTTSLRRRPDVPARVGPAAGSDRDEVTAGSGRVELDLGDRQLELPAALAPVLEHVLTAGTFRPRDLDDLIDRPSRLVLCRRLVREGLLTVDRSPTPDAPAADAPAAGAPAADAPAADAPAAGAPAADAPAADGAAARGPRG